MRAWWPGLSPASRSTWRRAAGRAATATLSLSMAMLAAGCGSLLGSGQPSVWYQLEDRPNGRAAAQPRAAAPAIRPATSVGATAATTSSGSATAAAATPARTASGTADAGTTRQPGKLREKRVATPAPIAAASPVAIAQPPRLMLSSLEAGPLYDSTGIVYGAGATRGYYLYANWSERPSRRLVSLLDARLNASLRAQASGERLFGWVALDTSGLAGDWLLGLRVKEFYHDTGPVPDRAVVIIDAELLDWSGKTPISRRLFRTEQPLANEDVGSAVAALSVATSQTLDDLVAWLETIAAARRPSGRTD